MKSTTLKAEELCKIIETCKAQGVIEFSFDKLRISFRPQAMVEQAPTASKPGETEVQAPQPKSKNQLTPEQIKALDELEEATAELVLVSPFELEQQIVRGELSDREPIANQA